MKIKILEKVSIVPDILNSRDSNYLQLPDLQPPEQEETEQFKYIRILIYKTTAYYALPGSQKLIKYRLRFFKRTKLPLAIHRTKSY